MKLWKDIFYNLFLFEDYSHVSKYYMKIYIKKESKLFHLYKGMFGSFNLLPKDFIDRVDQILTNTQISTTKDDIIDLNALILTYYEQDTDEARMVIEKDFFYIIFKQLLMLQEMIEKYLKNKIVSNFEFANDIDIKHFINLFIKNKDNYDNNFLYFIECIKNKNILSIHYLIFFILK